MLRTVKRMGMLSGGASFREDCGKENDREYVRTYRKSVEPRHIIVFEEEGQARTRNIKIVRH